jgi:hypothetical protein
MPRPNVPLGIQANDPSNYRNWQGGPDNEGIDLIGIIGRMLAGEDEQAVTTQPPGPIPGETASQIVSGSGPEPRFSGAVPPVTNLFGGFPADTDQAGLEEVLTPPLPRFKPEQAAAGVADVGTAVVDPTRPGPGSRFANVMENVTDLPQGSTDAITSIADAARSRTPSAEAIVPETVQTVPETVDGPGGGRFDVPTAGVDTSDRYAGIAAENPSVNIDQGLIDTISGGGVPEQGNYGLDGRINEITRGRPGSPNSDVRSMIAAMQSESPLLAQLLEQLLTNMVSNATPGRRF